MLEHFYLEAKFSRADFYLNILRLKAKIQNRVVQFLGLNLNFVPTHQVSALYLASTHQKVVRILNNLQLAYKIQITFWWVDSEGCNLVSKTFRLKPKNCTTRSLNFCLRGKIITPK